MISTATLAGRRIVRGRLVVPSEGAWWGDFVVDDEAAAAIVASRVSLEWEGVGSFVGTARRGDSFAGSVSVRVVGGSGGLAKTIEPRHYRATSGRLVASEICADAGETLGTGDALGTELQHWTRSGGTAGAALTALARAIGSSWRVGPSGAVDFAALAWSDSGRTDLEVLERDRANGRAELAAYAAPGTTLLGERIVRTTAVLDESGERFTVELGERQGLDGIVRAATAHVDLFASYAGTVVSQGADGTVDVDLDDSRIPDMAGVPLRYGAPGVSAKVPKGTRVLVAWENGDPSRPRVVGYESGSLTELSLDGGKAPVARVGDVVSLTLPPGFVFNGVSANPAVGAFVGTTVAPITVIGSILTGAQNVKA